MLELTFSQLVILSYMLTVLSRSLCVLHIYVQKHFNLAICSFICVVLTSLCVERLLSSLDVKMRILWCTQVRVSMWKRVSSPLWQSLGSKLRECHPHGNDFTKSETKHEKEGVKDTARKAKEEVTTSIKGHDFFQSTFSPPFSAPPSLSRFPVLQCASLFGRGKRSGLDRARNFFTCLLLHSAQSSGKRAIGMTRAWMRQYLGIFYGAAERVWWNRKSHSKHMTTEWKIKWRGTLHEAEVRARSNIRQTCIPFLTCHDITEQSKL